MSLWVLRVAWVSLPLSAGPAAANALDGWSTGPQVVGAAMLWAAWACVLVALLAPRPVGLTVTRIVGPVFFALAVVGAIAGDADLVTAGGAVVVTGIAATLSLTPGPALAAANAVAYGDERRFPLKTPPVLLLGPLPLAPLLVGAGIAAGPLLIAAERPVLGAVVAVVGLAVAAVMGRALHGLSRRWVVLVPAGLVLVDPLTLPDPVLFLRERIVSLRPVDPRAPGAPGTVDLRMGALADSLGMTLDREAEFLFVRRGMRTAVPAQGNEIRFAAVHARELLATAAQRRIRVTSS
ncbi:MAG TPA: hypothetical protein VF152_06550 [Acidimicrobiia bacterium]